MSAVSQTAATPAVRISVRALAYRAALPLLFAASCAYQFLQSRAHVAPTVFSDELLYAKLSQAIAAGHGLAIRGEHYAFPAPVAPLLQAPAWLLSSMTDGYAAAKLLNAVVMSAAVFPAYWLARSLVRRSFALIVATATIATPAMLYHAYLMSEAAAYPVFVLAVALLARAAAEPSRRLGFAVPLVCALAVATRVQFIVLPFAYLVAVASCGRGRYRRYVLPLGLLALLGAAVALIPRSLGSYGDAGQYRYAPGAVAHWLLTNASLLPFSVGLAIVPGALLGIAFGLVRPRSHLDRAVAAIAGTTAGLFLVEAALVSAGEAHRPLERYLFYVTPLAFLSFFAYVEHGAPRRIAHLGVAGVIGLLLSQVSLAGLTGTAGFFFDSVTESAYARAAYRFGLSPASLAGWRRCRGWSRACDPGRRPTVASRLGRRRHRCRLDRRHAARWHGGREHRSPRDLMDTAHIRNGDSELVRPIASRTRALSRPPGLESVLRDELGELEPQRRRSGRSRRAGARRVPAIRCTRAPGWHARDRRPPRGRSASACERVRFADRNRRTSRGETAQWPRWDPD